jgi:hypothetical protein
VRRRLAYSAIVGCLVLGGCHLLLPLAARDSGNSDGVPDTPLLEARLSDAQRLDRGRELAVDRPGDRTSPHDTLPVAEGSSPCLLSTRFQDYGPDMVICQGTQNVDQCQAGGLCNAAAGWTVCTASQFLLRGGKSTPATAFAWLAACVRQGGSAFPPTDSICDDCSDSAVLPNEYVSWACKYGTTSTGYSSGRVGVHAHNDCLRVGENLPSQEAYWNGSPSRGTWKATVCCKAP